MSTSGNSSIIYHDNHVLDWYNGTGKKGFAKLREPLEREWRHKQAIEEHFPSRWPDAKFSWEFFDARGSLKYPYTRYSSPFNYVNRPLQLKEF